MKEATSKVISCVFTGDWKNPSGGTTYYHEVSLENGDVGSLGSTEKNTPKFGIGAIITYQKDGSKLKFISSNVGTDTRSKKAPSKAQAGFLGYAWSYSKDLIIAGKTMDDVEELNKVARYIYDEIGKMLNGE